MNIGRLSDIAEQVRGVSYAKEDSATTPGCGMLPILRANNITDNGLDFSDIIYVTSENVSERQRLRIGDIVIAASSGSISVVGKAAQVETHFDGSFGAFCKVVRPREGIHDRYLGHYFRTPAYRQRMSTLAAGANINNLKNEHIDDLEIPLPPLDEQKRIAAILDQADNLRRLRQRANDRLNELGQAIFYAMFGNLDDEKTWERLGNHTTKIGSGATPIGGDVAYKSAGIPLVRSMNVRNGYFDHHGLAYIDEAQAKKLNHVTIEKDDVLLNITGASVARVCIAPISVKSGRVNQHVAIIRTRPSIEPAYLESFLLLPRTKIKLLSIAEAGATRQAITKLQIEELKVPIPPVEMQRKFAGRKNQAIATIECSMSQLAKLDGLFAALQNRAFNGEL